LRDPTSEKKKKITKKGWWRGSRCRPGVQAPVPEKKQNSKCVTISNKLPDEVAHIYNSNYSGGNNKEDQGSRPVQTKNQQNPISTSKMIHAYNPNYTGDIGSRILGQG
jgi:hypothetical protein